MRRKLGKAAIGAALLVVILIAIFSVLYGIRKAEAEPLDTYHGEWVLIRETADEDGASFSAVYDLTGVATTDGDFASKDSSTVANGGPYNIRSAEMSGGVLGYSPGSKWQFIICGKNYNNTDDTASFNVVGWSKTNGPLQNICEGSIVLGTQLVGIYPDSGDAIGGLFSETGVTYTHATTTFTDTSDTGAFDGAVAGMLMRVTGSNLTDEITQITTVTDANTLVCSGITSTDNNTDSTLECNPAFWADTITLDETTKWPKQQGNLSGVAVYNSGDNEIAILVIETQGLEYIQFVFYDCDAATGEEAGDITVYGRPY